MFSGRELIVVGGVLAGLAALLGVRTALDDPAPALDLALIGDSFPEQSQDQLLALADERGLEADVTAFGGSSICSWWDEFEGYAERAPEVLVVAFAGNDIHPCITDDPQQHRSPEAVATDYRDDLDTVLDMYASLDTEIYVVLPPPVGLDIFEERAEAMREMYRDAARDHPDLGLIDSATHLDPRGQGFRPTLPCEPWDDCPGGDRVRVRQEDLIHLTPAGGERYARAILDAVDLPES